MSALAERKLYLTAAALFLGASASQLLAKHCAGRGMMEAARAAAVPAERVALWAAAAWHVHCPGLWEMASFGLVALALGCWAASRKRSEPGPNGCRSAFFASTGYC